MLQDRGEVGGLWGGGRLGVVSDMERWNLKLCLMTRCRMAPVPQGQSPAPNPQKDRGSAGRGDSRAPRGRRAHKLYRGRPVLRSHGPGGVSHTCLGADPYLGRLPVTPPPGYQTGAAQQVEMGEAEASWRGTYHPRPRGGSGATLLERATVWNPRPQGGMWGLSEVGSKNTHTKT